MQTIIIKCPTCGELIEIKVDFNTVRDKYLKRGKPIPYVTKCPNEHEYVLYLAISNNKVYIRDIEATTETEEIGTDFLDDLFDD